jgi:thiol-disulfide isomerase/thioredoxin
MQDDSAPRKDDSIAGDPATTPADTPVPAEEPRLSRKGAWIAMGAVTLALGLLWAAPEFLEEDEAGLVVSGGSFDGTSDPDDTSVVGKMAPLNYTLKDLNGVDVKLSSFKGKVILLNFWATWCGPCKVEIPDLVELQNEHAGNLVVLGFLSLDPVTEGTRQFVSEYGMNYPILDGNGREDVEDAFGPMWGLPTSVIVGRDGKIAAKYSGIRSKSQLEGAIKALL